MRQDRREMRDERRERREERSKKKDLGQERGDDERQEIVLTYGSWWLTAWFTGMVLASTS